MWFRVVDATGVEYANRLLTLEENGHMIELLLEEEVALKITEDNVGMEMCIGPVESVGGLDVLVEVSLADRGVPRIRCCRTVPCTREDKNL